MEKIRLCKDEKRLLRDIALGINPYQGNVSRGIVSACADSLERHGLIKAAWASGHDLAAAELTHHGTMYLRQNPHLHNPVDWGKIVAVAAGVIMFLLFFLV